MPNTVDWEVHSMTQLSLFDQVELDSGQLKTLPPSIRENIFKGYSDVLNSRRMVAFQPIGDKIQFSAKTTAEGCILVSYDGVHYREAGSLNEYPKLLKAMRDAYDAAKRRFPGAFKEESSIQGMKIHPQIPGSLLGEACAVTSNVNSIFRNSFSAAKFCAPFVAVSGTVAGVMNSWNGARIAKREKAVYDRAASIGDSEGKTRAALECVMGFSYGMSGVGQLGGFFPSALSLTAGPMSSAGASAAQAFGYLGDASILLMALSLTASSLYEWDYVSEFRRDLHEILEGDASQQKKAIEGLEFLQQQVGLTMKDWGELKDKGLEEDLEAIRNKCQEKYDRFVRRVGESVAKKVVGESVQLICGVKAGNQGALEEAKKLLELADKESFKKRVAEITILVLSAIMSIAVIAGFVFLGFEGMSALSYAISAVFWMVVDSSWVYDKMGGGLHWLFGPSEAKRWGNSVEDPQHSQQLADVYKQNGQWDLIKLKGEVERDIDRLNLLLNGSRVISFEEMQRKLGLEGIDFTQIILDENLTEKQRKGLEFLSMLNGGILAKSYGNVMHPERNQYPMPQGLPKIDAHYNRERAEGVIRAVNVFELRKDLEIPSDRRIATHVEVDGSHTRLWTAKVA